MLDRYRRYIRRNAILDVRGNASFIRIEMAKWLFPLAMLVSASVASGVWWIALLAIPAGLFAMAGVVFILRHYLAVRARFGDKHYRLFTRKMLSKEYRED